MRNPRPACPNPSCIHFRDASLGVPASLPPADFYRKNGYRRARHNRQKIPRYQCRACGKNFSASIVKPIKGQHRPDLNEQILKLAVSGATMRRMVLILGCGKATIQRKIRYLADEAKRHHQIFMDGLEQKGGTQLVMMDELETFVHARYKQLSVPVAIRASTGQVIAFGVARTPSTMKQGGAGTAPLPPGGSNWQYNDRPEVVLTVLAKILPTIKSPGAISTDGDASYPKWVKQALPNVKHLVVKSPKESGLGRAMKKATGEPRDNDPLFAINVAFAKMRNDLARLGRKTWTTTKTIKGLEDHLWLWVAWNNGYKLR